MSLTTLLLTAATSATAQSCSVPEYPVSVMVADGQAVDSAFAAAVVQAVAQRWVVPSARRDDYSGWRRVRERAVQVVPRWADDWRPGPEHQARVRLVLRRRGRPTLDALAPTSADEDFTRSLNSIVRDPMPGSPELPELPRTLTADTLALTIAFGFDPDDGSAGALRFAAAQTRVEVLGNSLEVRVTRRAPQGIGSAGGSGATVKYDVTPDGRADPGSFEVLDGSDRDLVRAIREALPQARFAPATTNCEPVRLTVVQRFGG